MKNLEPYAIAQCGEDGSEWADKMLPSFPNKGANRRRLLAMKEAGEALAESPQIFAAAPELLEALEKILLKAVRQQASGGDLLDFRDRLRECGDIARAAIAKAKGQP